MKKIFVMLVFFVSSFSFAQKVAVAGVCQGGGCRYVCREEYKRCGVGKKSCKSEYQKCLKDCPR